MLIYDQFGIIQNLQTSPINPNQFLGWAFFCRLLQQDSSSQYELSEKGSDLIRAKPFQFSSETQAGDK